MLHHAAQLITSLVVFHNQAKKKKKGHCIRQMWDHNQGYNFILVWGDS